MLMLVGYCLMIDVATWVFQQSVMRDETRLISTFKLEF